MSVKSCLIVSSHVVTKTDDLGYAWALNLYVIHKSSFYINFVSTELGGTCDSWRFSGIHNSTCEIEGFGDK